MDILKVPGNDKSIAARYSVALQAVDLELARIRSWSGTDAVGSKLLIPAGDVSDDKVHDALQQLRTDVLAQWDAA